MKGSIDAALEAFQCGNYRDGEQQLTNYMKEEACSEHVRVIAEQVFRSFYEKSKKSGALLYLDLVHAPKNPEMLPVEGGVSKACTAEFRLFSLNPDGSLKSCVHEFVARYRLLVSDSERAPCRCCPL